MSASVDSPDQIRSSAAKAGEYDPGLPPQHAAEYVGLFPYGQLVVQPGAGHFAWLDDPDQFVRTVAGFLRQDSGPYGLGQPAQ